MPYCPKCGSQVEEEMTFCPKCGAALKAEQPRYVAERIKGEKEEKYEKKEKKEKTEKTEKHEKREYAFIGPLIGGLILIIIGLMSYLHVTGYVRKEIVGAFFLVILGVLVIIGAIFAARRTPKP
ncbi:MAG: zinc ribbon domain-containing protein [Candidatus Bathyarchaeia archaeon]